jgi:hypothetical protein
MAPYLDYRATTDAEQALLADLLGAFPSGVALEQAAKRYAIQQVVRQHLAEVQAEKVPLIDRTEAAVKERLTKEINHWDQRAQELKLREQAGRPNARINSARAGQRADELQARLQTRLQELTQERQISPRPPRIMGGALVIPAGLLARLQGQRTLEPAQIAQERKRVELAAMAAVMAAERSLGYQPRDVSRENLGYDIESRHPTDGDAPLRTIEVKGRIQGAETVTITRNELMTARNRPDQWILALVQVPPSPDFDGDIYQMAEQMAEAPVPYTPVRYVPAHILQNDPGFAAVSVNFDLGELWAAGRSPGDFMV